MKSENSDKAVSELFKIHRSELSYEMPHQLKKTILEDLRLESAAVKPRFQLFSWMSFGGGFATACLALIMAFQLGKLSVSGPSSELMAEEVVSSHVRALMAEHLLDVVSTDQHTVKPWFEGKIDFSPTVKDFSKEGFPLIGGRLDYIENRPTASLVYRFNQHVINVLEHPAPAAESSAPTLKTIRGYQIFYWTKAGMSYWAVSDLNAADLQKFVDLWS